MVLEVDLRIPTPLSIFSWKIDGLNPPGHCSGDPGVLGHTNGSSWILRDY